MLPSHQYILFTNNILMSQLNVTTLTIMSAIRKRGKRNTEDGSVDSHFNINFHFERAYTRLIFSHKVYISETNKMKT